MNFFPILFALTLMLPPLPRAATTTSKIASSALKPVDNGEYIYWSKDYKLTWDDFLSEPDRSSDAVASTSTALGISYGLKNGVFHYQVNCKFSKQRSWGLMKTPYILAHEQGHFDITEIFTRKLHQALLEYKVDKKTFQQDINDIYNGMMEAKQVFQMAYDGETNHSRNRQKQAEWNQRIEKMLNDTEAYANYPKL